MSKKKKKMISFITALSIVFVGLGFAVSDYLKASEYITDNNPISKGMIIFEGERLSWTYDDTSNDIRNHPDDYITYYNSGKVHTSKNDNIKELGSKLYYSVLGYNDGDDEYVAFPDETIPDGQIFYAWRTSSISSSLNGNRNKYVFEPVFLTYNNQFFDVQSELIYPPMSAWGTDECDGMKVTLNVKPDQDISLKDSCSNVIKVKETQLDTNEINLSDYIDSSLYEFNSVETPTIISQDQTTVTLEAHDGYVYSKDNGMTWQESNVFKDLTEGKTYQFKYKRVGVKNIIDDKESSAIETRIQFNAKEADVKIQGIDKTEYKVNEEITFTADYNTETQTNHKEGDTRYIPTSWQVNPSGTWDNAPYTATFKIENEGNYTLKVTYTKQTYHDGEWTNETDTYVLEQSFKITKEVIPPVEDEDKTKPPVIDPSTPPTNENEKPKVPSIDENATPNVPSIDNNSDTTKPSSQKKTNTSDETSMLIFGLLLGVSIVGGSICYSWKKKH